MVKEKDKVDMKSENIILIEVISLYYNKIILNPDWDRERIIRSLESDLKYLRECEGNELLKKIT